MASEDRKRLGITDGLIRVSIGVEATEDLIEDFEVALDAIRRVSVLPERRA
jgi:cystathionine beta-lyase/cystathionine gamma-synthase